MFLTHKMYWKLCFSLLFSPNVIHCPSAAARLNNSLNNSYCFQKTPGKRGFVGFPGSSAGKESACNTGDPGSIPGWGGLLGEGRGCPLHSWASLVAQLVKNPPAIQETWVWSLGWKDPQEKGTATHSSILAWRIPWALWSMGLQRINRVEQHSVSWLSWVYHIKTIFQRTMGQDREWQVSGEDVLKG